MSRAAAQTRKHGPEGSIWSQVIELVGLDAAACLSKDFGGRRIYIPRAPGEDHVISASIGHEKAKALAEGLAGIDLEPPISLGRRMVVVGMLRAGKKPEQISAALHCPRKFVFRVKKQLEEDEARARQLPLL